MSSSSQMHDLFAAARGDAPAEIVRDQVWGRVAAATSVPAGVALAAKATAAPAGKLVALGAVLGAAGAAAIALALTSFDGTLAMARAPAVVATGPAAGARLADPTPRGRAAPAPDVVEGGELATPAPAHTDAASSLAEEARLVTEARGALVRGEPERALALGRSIRALPARALEPEELGLEARALRALGRTDEALATELTLKSRFPSHALSR